MERAVVAIGVKSTGGLPELQAAVESATRFAKWARESQGIPAKRVILITDAKKQRVTRDRIFEAIEKITKLGFIEQLLVYFSGHGINSSRREIWLLSRAPEDPLAAVNVSGSELLARSCGIRHVVLISDACRTAADSIQAQGVTGGEIFPNLGPSGAENPVDQFFATTVGHPAYEVKDVKSSAKRYRAAYTTVLLSALEDPTNAEEDGEYRVIRPRALKKLLRTAVPAYIGTLKLGTEVNQEPDARIESEDDAWIARLQAPPAAAAPRPAARGAARQVRGRRPATRSAPGAPPEATAAVAPQPTTAPVAPAPSIVDVAQNQLQAALAPAPAARARGLRARKPPEAADHGSRFEVAAADRAAPFGPDHFESECGIKVRGALIKSATVHHGQAVLGGMRDVVRVELPPLARAVNVVVEFEDGTGAVIPALAGFVAALTVDAGGELDDIGYEPSAQTWRWADYQKRAPELRRLRSVVATSSSMGVFRLEDNAQAAALLQAMRSVKSFDPALAVYAAYAFHDRRRREQIRDMQKYLGPDLGVSLFDIAMLAAELGEKTQAGWPQGVYPCVPLLAQGWALLSPFGIKLPGQLADLRRWLRPSLWSHFEAAGVRLLREEVSKGKVG